MVKSCLRITIVWRIPIVFSIYAILSCQSFTLVPNALKEGVSQINLAATSSQMSLSLHHTAIKTRNITAAIQFYGLLGFEASVKFRAGPARAAWLEQKFSLTGSSRLELIEVPSYMLSEPEGMKRRAFDLIQRQEYLGHNHIALDVTPSILSLGFESLSEWIDLINQRSLATFGKNIRIAVEPRQQLIGNEVYELAFLYDADGALVELLQRKKDLPQEISSGWEPWDGKNFIGQ